MEDKITIDLTREEATQLAHDLSDILCWWKGYKAGLIGNENAPDLTVPEYGIEAALTLNKKIKDILHA